MEIEMESNYYRISLGDGKRGGYMAHSIIEVCNAINHHWGDSGELGENPDCPLCRAIHSEMKAQRQGKSWRTAK